MMCRHKHLLVGIGAATPGNASDDSVQFGHFLCGAQLWQTQFSHGNFTLRHFIITTILYERRKCHAVFCTCKKYFIHTHLVGNATEGELSDFWMSIKHGWLNQFIFFFIAVCGKYYVTVLGTLSSVQQAC